MSGAVAAHAAYNGSGTQGLAVTNKIQDQEGDVMSVFWNKNDTTRQLLHGSTILEVPASGNNGNVDFSGTKIFTINNDIDCLGELYINMKVIIKDNFNLTAGGTFNDATTVATANSIKSITSFAAGGTSYKVGDEVTITGGGGTGARFIVDTVNASTGAITGATLIDGGAGYTSVASALATTGGSGGSDDATVNVTTTNGTSDKLLFDANYPKLKFKQGALTNIIERVEYQVGTQIWQTLEKDDVRVVYNTEMSEAAYNTVSRRGSPSNSSTGVYDTTISGTGWYTGGAKGSGKEVDVTFIIPALTKTLAPQLENFSNISESGYPLAAAPHQSIKIKIYLASKNSVTIASPTGAISAGEYQTFDVEDSPYLSTIQYTAVNAGTISTAFTKPIGDAPLNIKSIKLYAKHLIMCNEEREQMKAMPLGLPKRLKMSQNSLVTDIANVTKKTIDLDHFSLYGSHLIISGNLGKDVYIKNAELKLNSSSFSGVLPAQMLDYAAASSLGLYVNRNIEYGQNEALDGVGILVFPLSSTAYSGSSVPLNRFDSIRLSLEFTGTPDQNASPYISITCIGETTALFKGGAASLAMY